MSRVRALASAARRRMAAPSGAAVSDLHQQVDRMRRLNRRLDRAVTRLEGRAGTSAPDPKAKKPVALPTDFDDDAKTVIEQVLPYTMTSVDKLFALITATRHIAETGVQGDFVECGVWRGGSMHAVARTLHNAGVTDRDLYLFDTFEGMTEPTERDVRIGHGSHRTAAQMLERADKNANVWAVASLEDVQEGVRTLPYPQERFHFVKGPVEETIPEAAPHRIALLRLDTDWYESTRHELEHLYDRLVPGGVLIIDDYGSWQGSKEATDEFLAKLEVVRPLMMRAGRARIGVKP
jgi:O-methyltransferase